MGATGLTQMRVAHAVLEVLRARGVRVIFGLPGSTEAALLNALREAWDVRYVLTLQEGVAVGMADGYARATRGPGVVNLHTTVGTLAGLSLLYNAWRDRVPVVVLASHKDTRILGRGAFTSLPDTPALARTLCKWAHQTLRADQVGEDVERAFQQALASPRGPAYVLIPEDLLAQTAPMGECTPAPEALAPRAHPHALEEVAQRLLQAQRPVMVVGSEVARGGASDLAVRLAAELELAVLWEPRRTLVEVAYPVDDPHFVGSYDVTHPAVTGADLLLVLGAVLFIEFSPSSVPEVPRHVQLIHVHPDAAELGRLYPPSLPVHADPGLVLEDLLDALRARREEVQRLRAGRAGWVAGLRARWQAHTESRAQREAESHGITAFQVGRTLRRVLAPQALVVEEAVRSSPAFLDGFGASPGDLLRSAGGALGWGVPAALGARMANPHRPVVAVVGDGSLHFTPQALWTGVRQRLPVLVVVLNNRKYLAVEAGVQRLLGGSGVPGTPGIDLSGIDHVTVARGYGAGGLRVEGREQLSDVLREGLARALEEERPYLVDVPVEDEPGP